MIINGLVNYFKSLAVGGGIVNVFTGWRKKVTLYYADTEIINTAKSIELDATTDFTVILDTDLLKTPAENQKVYTAGALKKPKKIEIRCHIEASKLEKLNQMREDIVPVWVLCSKNMAGTMTQVGYWADASRYGISSMTYVDTGYDNSVALTLTLEELRLFTYDREYQYDVKTNKIKKKNKSSTLGGSKGEVVPYGGILQELPTPKNKPHLDPNIIGG